MKTREYVFALVLLACSAITISLLMRSCKLSEAENLKKEIEKNGKDIQAIQQKRDSANAVRIPFSNAGRDSVIGSVNRKTGFDLYLRKPR